MLPTSRMEKPLDLRLSANALALLISAFRRPCFPRRDLLSAHTLLWKKTPRLVGTDYRLLANETLHSCDAALSYRVLIFDAHNASLQ